MEKTLIIDGRPVRFKCAGSTPVIYKSQFGREFFVETIEVNKQLVLYAGLQTEEIDKFPLHDLQKIDFDVFYRMIWTLAKTADKGIPDPLLWLDSFEDFPILDTILELAELITAALTSKKNSKMKIPLNQ
ncbi:hypothetical protein [Mangrovibacillus cuniculi]|uniref:Prophage pi2 protein 40 n=1 Tax=Mangrovibacillus cuniculi TaxID=2593652 RepID=A0A7S8HFR8_9BACI|nr:hypothetical protein [Mangrovibacillus cuniculi]QPC47108.1 hypothetical protein G8O30_09080 [Mangrovibacillus cuniculi]